MLKLTPSPEPFWLDLPGGARAQMKPIDTAAYLRAQIASRAVLRAVPPEETIPPEIWAESQVAFVRALVLGGLIAWKGVGDAEGKAAPVTPENVERLLAHYPAFVAFERDYAGAHLETAAEKKGSSPSRGGSSTRKGATPTAKTARPARPAKDAARPAPRKKTSRARTTG